MASHDLLARLLLLLSLLLVTRHPLNHFGEDLLSHSVMQQDLSLGLGLLHLIGDPQRLLFVFLDERVDVLRHLL